MINNHFRTTAPDIAAELNETLLRQDFLPGQSPDEELERCRTVARNYARLENSLAVLSDMSTDISHLFYGGFAQRLGMGEAGSETSVRSIWEKAILKRVHPDDLKRKYLDELRFFHFRKHQPASRRSDYYFVGQLRMRDSAGNYVAAMHRIFYIPESAGSGVRFALCLYNPLPFSLPAKGLIVDSVTGETREPESRDDERILSRREKQVLELIDRGFMSKNIADTLSISIHTVNRHRQEILKKFQVSNSIEACRTAKELGILR